MADPLRDDLWELARLLAAHAAWQRELGAQELPREGALPAARAERSAAAPSPAVAPAPPVEPRATTVEPRATIVEPRATTVEPRATIVEPRATTVEPRATPVEPRATPVEPRATTVEPRATTVERAAGDGREGRLQALAVIQDEARACTACGLAATRKNTVFARGNPFARLCFIGEGPGEHEDLQGLPFVGASGQLLDKIIASMGLGPDDVYIANIVKCRPPHNRVPDTGEMRACTPFLVRQLGVVRPEVIVTLGRTAASFILDSQESMKNLRGRWQTYEGIPVLPTWHPAYLLRTPDAKGDTWADMKLVMARLGLPLPPRRPAG